MSEQLPLGALFVDIVAPARADSPFHRLAQLAEFAFSFVDPAAAAVLPGLNTRHASILYPVGNADVEPFPTKVVLHQTSPAINVQQIVIDFQTKTAECDGHPNIPIEPEQIELVQQEVELYLQDLWRRKRAREKARQMQEDLAWRDFLERLDSHGILIPDSYSEPDSPFIQRQCPLCEKQTAPCTSCHHILCLNRECPASELIPFQSCSNHVSTAACLPCLDNAKGVPSLGKCPECHLWFCQYELTWCLGRPKDSLNRPPGPRTYFRRLPNSAREHPTQPIGCSTCVGGRDRLHCTNSKCWSSVCGYTNICEACSPGGGLRCACEQCWICDDCQASPTETCFKTCPRCKRVYCVYECEYIHFCSECGRTTLCDDCVEEAWLDDEEADEGVSLDSKCDVSHCCSKVCTACVEGARCARCRKTFCCSCSHLQRCGECSDGRFCSACYATHRRQCHGCGEGQKV